MTSPLEEFFGRLAQEAGTPPLGESEADDVLDLTRVVAHTVERRYAPLASYALGLALSTDQDPAERSRRVRELIGIVRAMEGSEEGSDG